MKRRMWFFFAAVMAVMLGCNDPRYNSGDRVLVVKYLYESKIQSPNRFDVVVFKYPGKATGKTVSGGPLEKNVPKNYIKRLLGLPGEVLAIFFGRLFRIPAPADGQPPYFDDSKDPNFKASDQWKNEFIHNNDPIARKWFDEGRFEIIRKTPDVMMAMRRIVFDNDFPAKDLVGDAWKRWKPLAQDSGWSEIPGNGFIHGSRAADEVDWLRYHHVLRSEEGPGAGHKAQPQLITDFLDYNSGTPARNSPGVNWIGDLMLECKLEVLGAGGEFRMELCKGINRFQARWQLTTGKCTLVRIGPDNSETVLGERNSILKGAGTYQLRFANIDARLTVWIDRELLFGDGQTYPPPEVRGPDDQKLDDAAVAARRGPTSNDLEPASLGSKGANAKVYNLRLWRDTYYTLGRTDGTELDPSDGYRPDREIDRRNSPWGNVVKSDPETWGNLRRLDFQTLYVQPGHYLCLGDNSPASSDSRDWGLVPERLMLGRALMVYFPFNRAGPIR